MSGPGAMGAGEDRMAGILWMLASGLAFVVVQGLVRHLGTDLPAAQSAFLRFVIGLVFLLPLLPALVRLRLSPATLRLSLLRGAIHCAAVVLWFYAMAHIPVAQVTAIGYLNPVIVMVAGAVILHERVTRARIVAVCVALAGALVVLRPGLQPLGSGHLAQIGAAIAFAGSYICARGMASVMPASAVVGLLSATVTLGLLPFALLVWQPVSVDQILSLAAVAVAATAGHYTMTRAFVCAPMAVTQPVVFLQLVWAAALGWLAFGEPLDAWVFLGGGLIIGALTFAAWADRGPVAGAKAAADGPLSPS